jgi:S-adenosylmethionine decarboxylase
MDTRGCHVIAELDGCHADLLSDPARVRRLLLEAARAAQATALAVETFEFANGGVSGFVLLAESHISIHTWPEHGYAAIDIYTCGHHTMPERAGAYLAEGLGATRVRTTALDRGLIARDGGHEHRLLAPREGEPSPINLAPTAA